MSITITEFSNYRNFQRRINGNGNPGGNSAYITISGTYATETPSIIYCRILDYITEDVIVNWSILDSSPSSGTFSGNILVPQGGWYKTEVRIDSDGNTDKTTNKWGVGIGFCVISQSKSIGGGDGGPQITVNDLVCNYHADIPGWRHGIEPWNLTSDDGTTCPLTTCMNTLAVRLNVPITVSGYGLGGLGIIADTVGKFTDRNASDPDDYTTRYGKLLTHAIVVIPEFIYIDIGDADASTAVTKEQYKTGIQQIHDWLETDLGYRPKVFITPPGRNNQGGLYFAGYAGIQNACQELHNGIDIFHLSTRWPLIMYTDKLHDTTEDQRVLGYSNGRALLRYFNGIDTRPGYITNVFCISKNRLGLNVTLPNGLTMPNGRAITGVEISDSFRLKTNKTQYHNNILYVDTKSNLSKNNTFRYGYGCSQDIDVPIVNSEEDAILQYNGTINFSKGIENLLLNNLPFNYEALTLFFSNWVNAPSTLQSGIYPSSPNNSYVCTINNSENSGDGYVKNTTKNGYFNVIAANQGYIGSNHKLSISNTSKFTIIIWFSYIPNNSHSQFFCGNYVDANNQWYCELDDRNGWKHISFYLKAYGTLQYARSNYNTTLTSSNETLCLVMFEKDGSTLRMFLWDGVTSGEVTYLTQNTYTQGDYTFGNTDFLKYISNYCTGKYYLFQIYNGILTSDQKTAIHTASKDMGIYGYHTNNIMRLYDDYTLQKYKERPSLIHYY